MGQINVRPDATWAIFASGHVSGTAAGLTGTLDAATNLNMVVSYPTGPVPSIPTVGSAPTGSVLIQLPLGNSSGIVKDQLAQTYDWDVTMEPGSGSDRTMDARAANGIMNWRPVTLAHNTTNGAYLFAFLQTSGSNSGTYGIPADPVNPNAMAARWTLRIFGRKTTRRQ